MPVLPPTLRRRTLPLVGALVPLIVLVVILLTSSAHVKGSLGRWTCRMSWMSPSYIQLRGAEEPSDWAGRWRLFLYREQGWDGDQTPNGLPVLYIPGNAGSYQQARSIASSAAHQFWAQPYVPEPSFAERGIRPLDIFTVDFNEALSAFHGPTLLAQSDYVASCVSHILNEAYAHLPQSERPQTVVLLGHSMGGIVARHAVTRLADPAAVHTVVTLSTPHQQAPVTTDSSLARVYSDIAAFFSPANAQDPQHPASNHLLVSLCGGSPDPMLAADACALPESMYGPIEALSIFTSGLVGGWTGVDHEAMVWCHQVRWRVARMLLELGGQGGRGLASRRADRRRLAADWFIGAGPSQEPTHKPLDSHGWKRVVLDDSRGRFVVPATSMSDGRTLVLFPLPVTGRQATFRLLTTFAIAAIGPEGAPSARMLHCSSATDTSTCYSLPLKTLQLLPPSPVGGGPFAVDGEGVDERDGLVWAEADIKREGGWVAVAVDGDAGWGVGEVVSDAVPDVDYSSVLGALIGFRVSLLAEPKRLLTSIRLPGLLSHSLLVYKASFHPSLDCNGALFAPLLRHTTTNSGPDRQTVTYESALHSSPSTIFLHSHSASAPFLPPPPASGMKLDYWSDPSATGSSTAVRIRLAWRASASRLILRYRMTAVAWAIGIIGAIIALQARHYRMEGLWPPLLEVYSRAIQHYGARSLSSLVFAQLLQILIVKAAAAQGWTGFAAFTSEALLGNHHLVFLPLPIILASASAGLVVVVLCALQGWTRVASAFRRQVDRRSWLLSRPRTEDVAALPSRKRQLVPVIALLLAVATIIPYQGAVLILFLVHALSTSAAVPIGTIEFDSTSSDASTSEPDAALLSRSNLYTSVLCLLLSLLPVNAPVLVVWARDLLANWRRPFVGDHNTLRVVGVIAVVVACEGGRFLVPSRHDHTAVRVLESALWTLSVFAIAFGSRHLYRVYDLANVALFVLAGLLWTA